MSVKLRAKSPYFCRHKSTAGKLDCLAPLVDSDGSVCAKCAKSARVELTMVPQELPKLSEVRIRRIWP